MLTKAAFILVKNLAKPENIIYILIYCITFDYIIPVKQPLLQQCKIILHKSF